MIIVKKLSIMFVLFVCLNIHAQTTIKGIVTGTVNEPLPYAIIAYTELNDSSDAGTITTDSTGLFSISIKHLPIVIITSYLSYSTNTILCKDNKYLHITLQPDTLSLGEVIVKGQKPKVRLTNEGVLDECCWNCFGEIGEL